MEMGCWKPWFQVLIISEYEHENRMQTSCTSPPDGDVKVKCDGGEDCGSGC
jgi:hypothetical protein